MALVASWRRQRPSFLLQSHRLLQFVKHQFLVRWRGREPNAKQQCNRSMAQGTRTQGPIDNRPTIRRGPLIEQACDIHRREY